MVHDTSFMPPHADSALPHFNHCEQREGLCVVREVASQGEQLLCEGSLASCFVQSFIVDG
jgi:hypothetical protein